MINFKLTATGGNVLTHGDFMMRLFKNTSTTTPTTYPIPFANLLGVWNKMIPRGVDVSTTTGTLLSNYCTIKAGEYWVQVLFKDNADFNVSLETSCPTSTDACHNDTYGTPRDLGIISNTLNPDTKNFKGCVSCSPPQGVITGCLKPYCSTFLKWNQTETKTIEVRFDPISNPNNFKVNIWRVESEPSCEYIVINTVCGNSSAVVPAGTYMMQIYTEEHLTTPVPVELSITFRKVTPDSSVPVPLAFPLVSIGNIGKLLDSLTYDATLPTIATTNLGAACAGVSPCDKYDARAVGFDLQSESFIKFLFDPAFKYKLYRANNVAGLIPANEVYACGDSTYFCSLQPGKYILVLFSDFVSTTKLIKITAWANCNTRAWKLSLANAPLNNLGTTGAYVTRADTLCCTSQRSDTDNLATTAAERHTWFSWTTTAFGKFNVNTTSTNGSLKLMLYYTDVDVATPPATIADMTLVGDNYTNTISNIPTTCRFRRYYMRVIGTPNNTVTASLTFTPEDGTLGDFISNAYNMTISGMGTYTQSSINIVCHTLSVAPLPDGTWDNGSFTNDLPANSYKSTWFKITNSSTPINAALTLNHSLTNMTVLRYRVLRTDATCTNVISQVNAVNNATTTPTMGIDCFNATCYYVQVITNTAAEGIVSLNLNATPAAPACPSFCEIWNFSNWNSSGAGSHPFPNSWFNTARWSSSGVPDLNTYAQIMSSSPPVIRAGETAYVGTLRIGSGLTLEAGATLYVNNNIINDTGAPLTLLGNVVFMGCNPQNIGGGHKIIFDKLEVKNSQDVNLQVDVEIKKHLVLTQGNLISNGKLTLLSNATETAMVTQKNDGSNAVIGDATVQRHITPYGTRPVGFGYTYISNPTTSGTVHSVVNDDLSLVYNAGYKWNCWLYRETSSHPFPNIFWYNESLVKVGEDVLCSVPSKGITEHFNKFETGWQSAAFGTALNPMDGVIINISGNTTIDATGTLNNGTLNKAISKTNAGATNSGWNLVGNPYPAPINWDLAYTANSTLVDAQIMRRMANGRYSGTFAYYIGNVVGSGTNGATNEIAGMQGFFVRALSSGNLQFTNAMRSTAYSNPRFFRTEKTYFDLMRLELQGANKLADETTIYFGQNATDAYEENADAWKAQLNSAPSPNLFTRIEAKDIAINGFAELREEQIIPLSFIAAETGKHTLKISHFDGFENVTVYLEDKKLNVLHEIVKSSYSFEAAKGADLSRFQIRFKPSAERTTDLTVILYPNPASSNIKIQLSKAIEANISIFDMLGRKISETSSQERETNLDIKALPKGVYVVEIQTSEGMKTVKFIKE